VVDLLIVTLIPDMLESGTVVDEMHHVTWSSATGAEVCLVREIFPEAS
jgi:hypothetical protein